MIGSRNLRDYTLGLNPMAYWRLFDDGVTTLDEVGITPGTPTNTPTPGSENGLSNETGRSYRFTSSSNERVVWTSTTSQINHADRFSVSLWTRRVTTGSHQMQLWGRNGGNGPQLTFGKFTDATSNVIALDQNGVGDCMVTVMAVTDTASWHHICVVKEAGDFRAIYYDGVPQALSTDTNRTFVSSGIDMAIGAKTDGSQPLDGYMQEVALFGRGLMPTEVATLCRLGRGF